MRIVLIVLSQTEKWLYNFYTYSIGQISVTGFISLQGSLGMKSSYVSRREMAIGFGCPIVLFLFQVGYVYFHRTLRSRISTKTQFTLCWTESYVKLWLDFFKVDANNPVKFLRKFTMAMRAMTKSWMGWGFSALRKEN